MIKIITNIHDDGNNINGADNYFHDVDDNDNDNNHDYYTVVYKH